MPSPQTIRGESSIVAAPFAAAPLGKPTSCSATPATSEPKPAAALLAHPSGRGLHHEERALDVHVHDPVEILDRHLEELDFPGHPGIVDQDID